MWFVLDCVMEMSNENVCMLSAATREHRIRNEHARDNFDITPIHVDVMRENRLRRIRDVMKREEGNGSINCKNEQMVVLLLKII